MVVLKSGYLKKKVKRKNGMVSFNTVRKQNLNPIFVFHSKNNYFFTQYIPSPLNESVCSLLIKLMHSYLLQQKIVKIQKICITIPEIYTVALVNMQSHKNTSNKKITLSKLILPLTCIMIADKYCKPRRKYFSQRSATLFPLPC